MAPIGEGYVFGDVCLHQSPSVLSLCTLRLTPGTKVEVLEKNIKNEANDRYMNWYKIRTNQQIGFVSQDEEEIRLKFSVIIPNLTEWKMVVTASSLRLRELPSLSAKVITSLRNGEIITAFGSSAHKFKVEDKWDSWIQVKTNSGISGFSYGGFLREVKDETEAVLTNEEIISGFVVLTQDQPTFWLEPNKVKLTDKDDSDNFGAPKSLLKHTKSGLRFPALKKAVVEGETYYYLEREFCYYSINSRDCEGNLSGWVSSNDLEYVKDSLYEKTLADYPEKEQLPLIQFLHNQNENPLEDVSTLKVNQLPLNDNQLNKVWDVSYKKLDNSYNAEWEPRQLIRQVSNDFYVLTENYSDSEIIDIDGDGISEWKSTKSGRADYSLHIYSLQNSKFVQILQMETNDYSPNSCSFTINNKEVLDLSSNTDQANENTTCSMNIESPNLILKIGKKTYKYTLKSGKLIRSKI
ncbi:SH3 domain-containing protein [Leptospira perdikensis]|uniref:SH3 domain-containing protein n=1 Tax=Leptospira perdikensis TaxID=2484948 RepID=UPI00142DFFF4|nr:SH3 domain-containing protein [Leptospira perdikensis]